MAADIAQLIGERLPLRPVPLIPEILLHIAEMAGSLKAFPASDTPRYWAYVWAGGSAVARHVLDHPETVRDRRVLDLGSGSGIVGIAAAAAGASRVVAAEIDPIGRQAIGLNSAANGVAIEVVGDDLLDGPVPEADVVLVGDMLYDRPLAVRVIPFLARCREADVSVLLGDPGRGLLPRNRVRFIAEYGAGRVEDDRDSATTPASVFAFE